MIDGHDTYSWAGESKFDSQLMQTLVPAGAISNGEFAVFLKEIFAGNKATFQFERAYEENGRKMLRYSFSVSLDRSNYVISRGTDYETTAYDGAFEADAQSFNLYRLIIRAGPTSRKLRICEAKTDLKYTSESGNELGLQRPLAVDLDVINGDGSENRNHIAFTGCRQFLGESKLIFDEANSPAATATLKESDPLPPGISFTAALAAQIDPQIAAAGDPVRGVLTHEIPGIGDLKAIPRGASVRGRVRELTFDNSDAKEYLTFGLQWEAIESDGIHPLTANLVSMPGKIAHTEVHKPWPRIDNAFEPAARGVGYFTLGPLRRGFVIPASFESSWITIAVGKGI